MISIITAAVIGGSLYFSLSGALWATHVIMFILGLNVILVLYSVSIVAGLQRTLLRNPEKRIEELRASAKRIDLGTLILLRIFLLVCAWHVYSLGYILFAGITFTTVTISLVISLLRAVDSIEEKEE
jgi:hypothetical protein